jgi:phage portal protein BeeE
MGIRSWWSNLWGQKSYSVQLLVGDEGFLASPSFTGGDLYRIYTQALWTYICASRISQDIAKFPAIVQKRRPGTDRWERDTASDLNALLDHPYGPGAAKPRWNWQQQLAAGVLRQELGGNQFYLMERAGNRLLSLGLVLGELQGQLDENTKVPTTYKKTGTNSVVSAEKVVNVMHASPDSWWSGVSPVIAAEPSIRVDYAASQRIRYDLETRIAPGVVFKVKALFTMSDKMRQKTLTMLEEGYEGATKAGKSLAVGDDTEIQGAPLHQVDDVPAHHAAARDAIISAFGISPPVVGVLRDVKYQTWEQALRAQFALCIYPRLWNIYNTINTQAITPVYGPDIRLWFDLVQSPLGLAFLRERGETAQIYMNLGYPGNAVNERFQLEMPRFDEMERPNMPALIAGRDDAPPSPEESDDEE